MKIEITPGPWKVFTEKSDRSKVWKDWVYPTRRTVEDSVCCIKYLMPNIVDENHLEKQARIERLANARAISAVPEMLEVLVEIKQDPVALEHLLLSTLDKIDNALRKAGVME